MLAIPTNPAYLPPIPPQTPALPAYDPNNQAAWDAAVAARNAFLQDYFSLHSASWAEMGSNIESAAALTMGDNYQNGWNAYDPAMYTVRGYKPAEFAPPWVLFQWRKLGAMPQ